MAIIKEFQGEYRWLSNFAPVNICYNDMNYPSVEHAYQSAKSNDIKWKKYCSNSCYRAGQVKRESKKVILIDNWEHKKVSIMKELLILKFNDPIYRKLLINTGDRIIQEGNMWGDVFWGIDLKTGHGNNILGKLIMEIRDEIKNKNT